MAGNLVCGIDEAGRGAWAGPVCAAAVILRPETEISGLNDSKKLTVIRREALETRIKQEALSYGIGWASSEEIDEINIRQATHLAMRRAHGELRVKCKTLLIDGNDMPLWAQTLAKAGGITTRAIIGGDGLIAEISAASIIAKTARDDFMRKQNRLYPHYGFGQHKGYGVKSHLEALREFGACQLHRHSFKPIRDLSGK